MSGAELDDLLRSVGQLPADREGRDALSAIERGLMRRVCGGYVALLDAALVGCWTRSTTGAKRPPRCSS